MSKPRSTKDRLIDAGLRLFAERGFDSVSVGDIEREVGLVPRRGALYRHFASKADLLTAAVEARLDAVAAARVRFTEDDPVEAEAADAEDLARWILIEMTRQQAITQVLERDGARLPELRDRFRADISDVGYTAMAEILRGWLLAAGRSRAPRADLEAVAVLLLGALINFRRSAWTLGAAPLGVDDDRLVAEWARLCGDVTGVRRR